MNLHFSIHGDFVTDHIRNLVEEGSIVKAWNTYSTITEDENIFRDIIKGRKGFEGVNEFELITLNKEDLTQKTLAYLAEQLVEAKNDFEVANTFFNSPLKYFDNEDEMTLGELVEIKKTSVDDAKEKVAILQENFDLLVKLFNYTQEDIILSCLIKLSSKDLSSSSGWITEKGWFLPVPSAGHDNLIYSFNDKMKTNFSIHDIEKRWVRISTVYKTLRVCAYNFALKPKQAITLEKWLLQHEAIKDGGTLHMEGYGFAYREGNMIKFTKRSED